jgi:hypothetical protein
MANNSANLPASTEYGAWITKLPLTEQRLRTEKTTKQLADKATKAFGRILKKELKKLEKVDTF